jgi:hypothetical protein
VVLTVSPQGDRVWQRLMQVIDRRNAEIVACLDARERQQLSQLLDRLVDHARQAGDANRSVRPDRGLKQIGHGCRQTAPARCRVAGACRARLLARAEPLHGTPGGPGIQHRFRGVAGRVPLPRGGPGEFSGRFRQCQGAIRVFDGPSSTGDAARVLADVRVSIDIASVDTGNALLDRIMQGAALFDSARFPQALFLVRSGALPAGAAAPRAGQPAAQRLHAVAHTRISRAPLASPATRPW